MKLQQSNITFDELSHTYTTPEGELLSGVTSLLNRHLFSKKYDGIPDHILKQAAERGTEIHSLCEAYNMIGVVSDKYQEIQNFADLLKDNDITIVKNEYLVSDNSHYATMIDCLGDNYNLYDIKTTSYLDKEYLSWQLSICAYLFELQNPKIKAGDLYGIWLRGEKAELVQVARIEDKHIKALFEADIKGEKFENPFKDEDDDIDNLAELEQQIEFLKGEIKQIEDDKKEILDRVTKKMRKSNMKKWEAERLTITIVDGSKRTSFDSKKFKEDYSDLYSQYTKETQSRGHIKIKLNN